MPKLEKGTRVSNKVTGLVGVATGNMEVRGRIETSDGEVVSAGREYHEIEFTQPDTKDTEKHSKLDAGAKYTRMVPEDHFSIVPVKQAAAKEAPKA